MTAWTRAGRTAANPSRLALSRHRFAAYGLDRLSVARQGLSKRSWLKVSGVAPIAKASPPSVQSVPWRRNRSFRLHAFRATLAQCPAFVHRVATAPNPASCQTIFTSRSNPGRASAVRRNTTLRRGALLTTGQRACRLRTPKWTYSRRGSAMCSTNYSGRADDVRRLPT